MEALGPAQLNPARVEMNVNQGAGGLATAVKRATMATQAHHDKAKSAHYRVASITVVATFGLVALGHDSSARVFVGWALTAAAIFAIVLVYRPVLRFFPGTPNEPVESDQGPAEKPRAPLF